MRWSKTCGGPLPAASLPPTAIAPLKASAFWKKPFAAACGFGRFSSASQRWAGRKSSCLNSARRLRRCCCPTSCLPARSRATPRKAWRRWRAGRNSRSKMCWPGLRRVPCWLSRECRTREIWGQSCAPPRPSAPAACSWERARSVRSIPKLCGLRQVRYSGCRWREESCLKL